MNEIASNSDPSTPEPIVKYSEEWWVTRRAEVRARRCRAHKKNGDQCGKVAMEFQRVCGTHGGRAPQAKRKARQLYEEATYSMAAIQIAMVYDPATPPQTKLNAIKDIQDRGGVPAKQAVDVNVERAPWEELIEYASQPPQPTILQITRAQHEAMKRGDLLASPLALPPANNTVDAEPRLMPHAVPPDSTGATCDRDDRAASREARFAGPSALPSGAVVPSANGTADARANIAAKVAQAKQRMLASDHKIPGEEQTDMC